MKIGIIGTENSHTEHFLKTLNADKAVPDARVAYLFGDDDPEKAAKLASAYGAELCGSEDELIERSDAVAITYRKGSRHPEPAMKVIRAGKPLFNDKPFAASFADAERIVALAADKGVPVTGGSNLKGLPELPGIRSEIGKGSVVTISFAADPDSEYDGYWFYGIHAAELCLVLCGPDFTSVEAWRNGDAVTAAVAYPDRTCLIVSTPSSADLRIAVTNDGRTEARLVPLNYQSVGPKEFCDMIRTGVMPRDPRHFVRAAELVEEIIKHLA